MTGVNKAPSDNIMEEISMNTTVLVIGGGWNGITAAWELVQAGFPVLLAVGGQKIGGPVLSGSSSLVSGRTLGDLMEAVQGDDRIDMLTDTKLVSLGGAPGDFHVRLAQAGSIVEKDVGAVVLALDARSFSLSERYGLDGRDNVLSQSALEEALASAEKKDRLLGHGARDILFLVGLGQEGNPVVMERAIRSAIEVQEIEGAQATILVGNVKLAHQGLEALYKQSREKGVLYIKLKGLPQIGNGSGLSVTVYDPVLHADIELRPGVVVVDEALRPHPQISELAGVLGVGTDSEGFLQSDNVHFFPVRSNREGIFVVGSARRQADFKQGLADAQNLVLEISHLLGRGKKLVPREKARIHRGKCTICLTCFRVCPHGAITWDNRAVISPVACQGCGICAGECPMDAIQLVEYEDDQIRDRIVAALRNRTDAPVMIAFCCRNSAHEAGETARMLGHPLPEGLRMIKVPCAGKVDVDYILTAFEAGADGVLVLACHKDNCKSEHGNTFAGWRVEDAVRMLEEVGLEKERLQFATLASNMPMEFFKISQALERKLKEIGPSRVRKQALARSLPHN